MKYDLSELFISLMGETKYIGYPALFVRVAGCNMSCQWCDTKFSQNLREAKTYSFAQIIEDIKNGPDVIVFTGGEPLFQKNIAFLMEFAKENKKVVVVYTNNSILIKPFRKVVDSFSLDFKLKASGMRDRMKIKNLDFLDKKDDLKFVVANREDYEEAKKILEMKAVKSAVKRGTELYMTPASNHMDPRILARWILEDKLWNVRQGIQMHKVIWGPDIRGV